MLIVGAGGFLGAVSRYWLSSWIHRWAGGGFPWGTLAVNTVGCLAIGAVMALLEVRVSYPPEARLFLSIGLLGSMTTFSTFGYDTVELARRSEFTLAATNAVGSLILGLGAVLLGRALVRWLAA
jgi:CrcB protein